MAEGNHPAAVAAATSGLPDAEAPGGDPDRIAVLRTIDHDQLAVSDRVHLRVHLSRQLLFVGQQAEAQELADQAYAEAKSPDELARAWLATQVPGGLGLTNSRPTQMAWFEQIRSPELRAGINQVDIINAIGEGGSNRDYGKIVDHVHMTGRSGYPQLEWLAKIYQATALTDQGRQGEAMTVAAEALKLGERAGLRISGGTYETQHFCWKLHEGSHGQLFSLASDRPSALENRSNDPAQADGNILFAAASAAAMYAHAVPGSSGSVDAGVRARARALVAEVGGRAPSSAFDLAVVGILADGLSDVGDPDLVRWATDRLAALEGRFLLLASAAANLGPVEGILAKLAKGPSDKVDLFRSTIATADRHELPLWQVLGRLRLAKTIGLSANESRNLFLEAKELAVTPWLVRIVDQNAVG